MTILSIFVIDAYSFLLFKVGGIKFSYFFVLRIDISVLYKLYTNFTIGLSCSEKNTLKVYSFFIRVLSFTKLSSVCCMARFFEHPLRIKLTNNCLLMCEDFGCNIIFDIIMRDNPLSSKYCTELFITLV